MFEVIYLFKEEILTRQTTHPEKSYYCCIDIEIDKKILIRNRRDPIMHYSQLLLHLHSLNSLTWKNIIIFSHNFETNQEYQTIFLKVFVTFLFCLLHRLNSLSLSLPFFLSLISPTRYKSSLSLSTKPFPSR